MANENIQNKAEKISSQSSKAGLLLVDVDSKNIKDINFVHKVSHQTKDRYYFRDGKRDNGCFCIFSQYHSNGSLFIRNIHC